jgi:hypothetical protein
MSNPDYRGDCPYAIFGDPEPPTFQCVESSSSPFDLFSRKGLSAFRCPSYPAFGIGSSCSLEVELPFGIFSMAESCHWWFCYSLPCTTCTPFFGYRSLSWMVQFWLYFGMLGCAFDVPCVKLPLRSDTGGFPYIPFGHCYCWCQVGVV